MKFSSLVGDSRPETPKMNAISVAHAKAEGARRETLLQAIEAGKAYESLPEDVQAAFSLTTFNRLKGKQ